MRAYPTWEAMALLERELLLPATGEEQDWDIELADPSRVDEFLCYLESHDLSEDARFALMALIIASLDDLSYEGDLDAELVKRTVALLEAGRPLYDDLILYWRQDGEGPDGFNISPTMRLVPV